MACKTGCGVDLEWSDFHGGGDDVVVEVDKAGKFAKGIAVAVESGI